MLVHHVVRHFRPGLIPAPDGPFGFAIGLLNDVLYMGRPAFGQEQSVVGLFKIGPDGVTAERTQVKLGKSSVNTMEVLSGLKVGDQVILSDMSAYDAYDRIRLK